MNQSNKDFNKIVRNLTSIDDTTIEIRETDEIGITEIKNPSPDQIIQELQKSVCTVFFYKIGDGSYRRMVCTLNGHEPVPSKYNRSGVIVVWDVEHNNWRSFYANRVFKLLRNEKTKVQ
jgi:hypothetical protein